MSTSTTQPDPTVLGAALRTARKQAGYSQQVIADKIGVARTTLVAIETGQRRTKVEELTQLAAIYKLPLTSFLIACQESETRAQLLALSEAQRRMLERLIARPLDPILVKIVRNLFDEPEVQEAIASTLIHLLLSQEEGRQKPWA